MNTSYPPYPLKSLTRPHLSGLTYCLRNDFPPEVTGLLLHLAERPNRDALRRVVDVWSDWEESYLFHFPEVVEAITSESLTSCDHCEDMLFSHEATWLASREVDVCESCLERNYAYCDGCDEYATSVTKVASGSSRCDYCLEDYEWCSSCDGWYDDNHSHSCECVAPHEAFRFWTRGGTVREDERFVVELPAGTIDAEGIAAIEQRLRVAYDGDWEMRQQSRLAVEEVGHLWQSKRGNFTKRLSRALYERGLKVDAQTLADVGNLARSHSSDSASWNVEFTRDLNQPAYAFAHEDSCWWGSESQSRCALKSWGGLAMRTFADEANGYTPASPSGRIWVQPLNAHLEPTHDTLNAHAYVLYNGYGDLGGSWVPARIIAHLRSMSYKKVSFSADNQSVNNGSGYLVSDETTLSETFSICLQYAEHSRQDADRIASPHFIGNDSPSRVEVSA